MKKKIIFAGLGMVALTFLSTSTALASKPEEELLPSFSVTNSIINFNDELYAIGYSDCRGKKFEESPLRVFRTTDEGQAWSEISDEFKASRLCTVTATIVFQDELYIALSDKKHRKVEIWKTADGENFIQVLGNNDSIRRGKRQYINSFFSMNNKLYAFGYSRHPKLPHNKMQVHESTDGETWTKVEYTGWLKKHASELKRNGISAVHTVDDTVYAIAQRKGKKTQTLLKSSNGKRWQSVSLEENRPLQFSAKKPALLMLEHQGVPYLVSGSMRGDGVKVYKQDGDTLEKIASPTLKKLRRVYATDYDEKTGTTYIVSKFAHRGWVTIRVYSTTDMKNWEMLKKWNLKSRSSTKKHFKPDQLRVFNNTIYLVGNSDHWFRSFQLEK